MQGTDPMLRPRAFIQSQCQSQRCKQMQLLQASVQKSGKGFSFLMLDEPYVKKMLYFQNHALGQPLYKSRLSPLLSYFKTPRNQVLPVLQN